MSNSKPSFNFYESFGDVMEGLNSTEQLELFWMIFSYGIHKCLPHEKYHSNKLMRIFHNRIIDKLDKGWKSYYEWEKRKEVKNGQTY